MSNYKVNKRARQKAENEIRNDIPRPQVKVASGAADMPNLFVRIHQWWHAQRGPVFYVRVSSGLLLALLSLLADITALSDADAVATPVLLPVVTAQPTFTPTVEVKKTTILYPTAIVFPTPLNTPVPLVLSHEVQDGENLSCISEKYYGDAKYAFDVCAYNYDLGRIGPDCNKLQVGEILLIPTQKQSNRVPPLLLTPGIRGIDYYCEDSDPTLVNPVSPLGYVIAP